MSFNKVVNGVTFTSDNYSNLDIRFEKNRSLTYIYISTTDNHAFNSTTISNYYIVHDYSGLYITKIELQNDNKTAKLSVLTSEFNESNNYYIQQLPLVEIGPTQKLEDHSENGYKVYIPNDCTSINGVRTRPSYTGYAVVPPTGLTLNSDTVKTIYADVNGNNNNRVQGILDGTNIKFVFTDIEWKVLNYSHVRDIKGNLIINLQDYVKQLTPHSSEDATTDLEHINPNLKADNVSVKITGNTVTLTANSGYKIKNAVLDIGNSLFGDDTPLKFTVSQDQTTASVTVTDKSLIDPNQEYDLTVHTDKIETKPYTLADVGLQCHDKNATLKVVDNTATLTAVSGYKITSATITSKNSYDFSGSTRQDHDFTISKDGSSATITLVPLKTLNYFLKVSTEEKPKQPTEKTFKGEVKLRSDVKDKLTFNFDNIKTVTIRVTDNKYNINSLYIIYQPYPAGELEQSKNGFTIAPDKKSATLVIPSEILDSLADDISIGGDIADTTPLTPSVAKTQRVYMIDDNGLNELTKQAESSYGGGMNVNYDFTEFINQLYYLPFTVDEKLSDPTNKIDTGLWSLNAPAREMKDNVLNIDLGTINVIPENNNGFDYNIESIKLYLPLVLPIQIDFQDCYKKSISINYKINLLTGSATINILSNDKLISTFNQNVQTNLQMFSIYNNKDFGSLNNSINNELLTPYIKINYYKPVENLVSYETMEHNILSSYTNFVKTRNANVSCGTQQEQQEIESLLNGGIYIKWV